jgi:hypothetical protein
LDKKLDLDNKKKIKEETGEISINLFLGQTYIVG